ncbi:MAG: BNR-4 repeat-containing protein, partial [Balneolaceae bacterium]
MRLENLIPLTLLCAIIFAGCSTSGPLTGDPDPEEEPLQVEFEDNRYAEGELINRKLDGFRGIWYKNQDLDNEYVYKYSGGLATYPQQHIPIAIYSEEANKTFFTYGGTDSENSTLLHMVSYFDHTTGEVARPTLVLDKHTTDAHDNPVMSIDDEGYIWIFANSHGRSRPSYVIKSKKPYNIDEFEKIEAMKMEEGERVPMDNFSYMQAWHLQGQGFVNFFTKYNYPADRTLCFMTSDDGESWSEWQRLAAIKKGHYQISTATKEKAGTAFDFHPDDGDWVGLNYRTNLYYVETPDFGKTWQTVDGKNLELPLTEIDNPALVKDYYSEKKLVYLKDIQYDDNGYPVILYMTSNGYESGPQNSPRMWHTARWTGEEWEIEDITTSDNNYDHGSLYIDEDGTWRIIGPTDIGPQ